MLSKIETDINKLSVYNWPASQIINWPFGKTSLHMCNYAIIYINVLTGFSHFEEQTMFHRSIQEIKNSSRKFKSKLFIQNHKITQNNTIYIK